MKYLVGFILAILITLWVFIVDLMVALSYFLWTFKFDTDLIGLHNKYAFYGQLTSIISMTESKEYGSKVIYYKYKTYYHYIWGIK